MADLRKHAHPPVARPVPGPFRVAATPLEVDVGALERDLRARVRGEVRFDDGSRALYATDASNYRQVPIGVVIPRDTEDVVQTVAMCRRHGAPIVSRGGGTSLAGQTCNVAIVLDFSKYLNTVVALDPARRRARVLPGLILDHLRNRAEEHQLTFGPDPATHNRCTLGGMIGNDSCGMHAQMAGRTSQNIESLEVLLYDGTRLTVRNHYTEAEIEEEIRRGGRTGEIFGQLRTLRDTYADTIRKRFPRIPRVVSGYGLQFLLPENRFNLAGALVGSEGTLVTVLEATTTLIESPQGRTMVVLGYPDVYAAGDHVKDILPFKPIALEGLDDLLITYMRKKGLDVDDLPLLPEGDGWLLVEFGGRDRQEADAHANAMIDVLRGKSDAPTIKLYDDPADERKLWEIRESGLGATALVPGEPDSWPGWEDSAVDPDRVGDYLRALRALFDKYGYKPSLYGHFGQGCIHCRVQFDLKTAAGLRNYRAFLTEAARLVVSCGGSLSGEHGDGQSRGELLPIMFPPEIMAAFRTFKAIWDPDGKMNPGKLIDARPILADLRLGTTYDPPALPTHFKFPDDHGSFAHATTRCVGVGVCRRTEGGTMCPSFRVTREEEHTTRGRAHALFEMLEGDVLSKGWKDAHVKDTLDLCLSCKGCKADCPVNVDMATYKAEFLSHYYEGRLRPLTGYTMGLIMVWARVAARIPRLVNLLTHAPGLRRIAKALGGIDPRRTIPAFANETFQAWWARRAPVNAGAPRVLLWVDTFNDHFHPQVAKAAVEVLEAAGFQAIVPKGLCCGRPLYDYGMLDKAKGFLHEILDALAPMIHEGLPMVGLEPSCVAVFRDEMVNLMPEREDAKRLKAQTFLLSEFLITHARDFQWPKLGREAVVHFHCHHKSIMKTGAERQLLDALGIDYEVPEEGCCGMAGAFGFEAGDHCDVALKIGERALLPAVRALAPDTLVITDGFSCHEQIEQGSGRPPLHLAEVLHLALREVGALPAEPPKRPGVWGRRAAVGLGIATLVGVAVLAGRARAR